MSSAAKDTVYIDIDDEITAIIDKVRLADKKVVALVLPKRAAVLQSIVNMKLLKRTGDEAKKHIVLITSESSILPLAGAVGLHVAKTLQSKPAIPPAPKQSAGVVAVDDKVNDEEDEPKLDKAKPVGALAGLADDEETIEVDNSDPDEPAKASKSDKKPLSKKLKVPNFERFRSRLFLGGLAVVLLIIFWYMAAFVWPKATITIVTDSQSLTTELAFSTQPDLQAVDLENKLVPAIVKSVKKSDTEKIAASGQKDAGTKATGTMNIQNCEDSKSHTVAAGTIFSANSKNYISTQAGTVSASGVSGGNVVCGSGQVPVAAAENGDSYNQNATSYTSSNSGLSGKFYFSGSAMNGGVSKMIKVVSQQDIDSANQKIQDRLGSNPANELVQAIEADDLVALTDTIVAGTPEVTATPNVGDEASEVTVTASITYTMVGVKRDELVQLLQDSVKDQLDADKQAIIDDGLSEAIIRATDKKADGNAQINLQTILVAGAKIEQDDVKQQVAGKKRGDTQSILSKRPGVKDVRVDYSPFWVYSTPKKTSKITILIEQSQ